MRGKLGIELSERSSGLLLLLLLIEWRRGSGGWRCGRCISTITSSRFGSVVIIEQVRIKQVVVDVIWLCDVRRGRGEETRQVEFGFGHGRRRRWRREEFGVVFATVTRRLVFITAIRHARLDLALVVHHLIIVVFRLAIGGVAPRVEFRTSAVLSRNVRYE